MNNYLFKIAYDGSNYKGFQVQKNGITIAEVFQNAIEIIFGKRYDIKGCSRTDSGVHANEFYISMKCDKEIPCAGIIKGMNINLPFDVVVTEVKKVEEDFHARYNCIGKRYQYKIHNSEIRNPFLHGRAMEFKYHIDEKIADRVAKKFIGKHDFTSFCRAGSSITDFERTIYSAKVIRDGDMICFFVEGDGFLYNMVRIMAGTIVDASQGMIDPENISEIIKCRDRNKAGRTAPACGLYLDKVYYETAPWLK